MTFSDQIKEAFETLTVRLRGEIDRQVQSAIAELSAAASVDRERAVSEARSTADDVEVLVASARRQAHEDGYGAGKEDGRAIGTEEGRREGVAEGRQQAEHESREALDTAVAAAKTAAAAGTEEGHLEGVAEGGRPAEHEGRGALDAAVTVAVAGGAAGGRSVDAGTSERLAAAVRSIDSARSLSEILDSLVTCAGLQAARAGVWLKRGGRFSSWRVLGFGPEFDNDLSNRSLDLWHDDAGLIAEAAGTNAIVRGDAGEAAPPPFAGVPPVRASMAAPIAMNGQVVAVLYADEGPSNPPARLLDQAAVEVLTRYASRCLEALTAFKAARALTERPGGSDATATAPSEGAIAEDDASARRYARLLVSEIKLYHESAVVDGRRDRDLATRLGGEIAHARALYEQRVPPDVRRHADFFRDELVSTLADGDPSLLELKAWNP